MTKGYLLPGGVCVPFRASHDGEHAGRDTETVAFGSVRDL